MKPAIPAVTGVKDPAVRAILEPVKENIEKITGKRGTKLVALSSSATTAQIIAQLNAIVAQLQ